MPSVFFPRGSIASLITNRHRKSSDRRWAFIWASNWASNRAYSLVFIRIKRQVTRWAFNWASNGASNRAYSLVFIRIKRRVTRRAFSWASNWASNRAYSLVYIRIERQSDRPINTIVLNETACFLWHVSLVFLVVLCCVWSSISVLALLPFVETKPWNNNIFNVFLITPI